MALMNGKDTIVEKSKSFIEKLFTEKVGEEYSYHNFDHTMDVYNASLKLSEEAKLKDKDKEVLLISSLFHDAGFSVARDNHEEHSKEIAKEFLEKESYDKTGISSILDCINATKLGYEPKTELEKLIKDADLSGLSTDSYLDKAERIRREINHFTKEKITKKNWEKVNVEFIRGTNYFSESGKKLFGPHKNENLKELEAMMERKKEKKKKTLTIANSKSAQTQFKTALRNHIDLSAIADNKANIMLSVNALIITVALPILAEIIRDMPMLLYPTLTLLIVSVTSMIFATLATRPIKMKGNTSKDQIKQKKSNLFFFGNFYNMKFDAYEEGIREVVAQDDVLDNAITRDLFYLGKALGAKYNNLRWCYNIFMFGIIITILVFVVVFIVSK